MASSQGHTMFVVVADIYNNKLFPIITLGITHFVKNISLSKAIKIIKK
jgi:hypothetical protein